jgi:subtilisin family serine protease
VQSGHPLIGPALGEGEVFPDRQYQFVTGGPNDGDIKTGGHGTGVSGIAIYGDVAEGIKNKSFQPQVWLFSARVTNENNEYKEESLLENQLEEAIDYFVRNYSNCKVINISLGDSRLIYQEGEKQFRLAARIDEIAYRLQHKNILFVISAGNFWHDSDSPELIHTDYPNYLLGENARIIDPATAAIALTVGSISMGKGSSQYQDDAKRRAIAKVAKYPSPFTRSGFGVDSMIKPDLVEFGGDSILDGDRVIDNDPGAAVITLNKNFQSQSLFKAYIGTSFSAPRVANLAAKLFTKFPDASSNLIRAVIADSAEIPMEFHLFRNVEKEQLSQAFTDAKKIDDPDFTEVSIGDLKKEYGSSIEINFLPKLTTRKKGTLQKGQYQFSSSNWKYDYKPLYLVVTCNKKWINPEQTPSQRYALIVSIAHSDPGVEIYNQIKLQMQGQEQASERIRI